MSFVADAARYQGMSFNRVGRSGLQLPAVSLGLWQNFGDARPMETQRAIVRRAFDLGVTNFDLANRYGPPFGSAEVNFGRILSEDLRPYRDELIIATKAGYDMWPRPYGEGGSRKHLLASLDQSLKRLGLDYVDIFYTHRPDPATPIEETMGAIATAIQQGKALYAGISSYDPLETRAAVAALAQHTIPVAIHQPRYSMFDRHIEQEGLLPVLEEEGMGAIVFSPLAQGMLTDRYLGGNMPEGSRAAAGGFISQEQLGETYLARAGALNSIAQRRGQTLAQLALAWVLRQPQVASAVIGASSVAQLEQNVQAVAAPPLDDKELAEIDLYAIHGTERA